MGSLSKMLRPITILPAQKPRTQAEAFPIKASDYTSKWLRAAHGMLPVARKVETEIAVIWIAKATDMIEKVRRGQVTLNNSGYV
jgi:hypothetical protein